MTVCERVAYANVEVGLWTNREKRILLWSNVPEFPIQRAAREHIRLIVLSSKP